jgi:hypothetical protein
MLVLLRAYAIVADHCRCFALAYCFTAAATAAKLVGAGKQSIGKVMLRALNHVQCNVTPIVISGDTSSPGISSVCSQQ